MKKVSLQKVYMYIVTVSNSITKLNNLKYSCWLCAVIRSLAISCVNMKQLQNLGTASVCIMSDTNLAIHISVGLIEFNLHWPRTNQRKINGLSQSSILQLTQFTVAYPGCDGTWSQHSPICPSWRFNSILAQPEKDFIVIQIVRKNFCFEEWALWENRTLYSYTCVTGVASNGNQRLAVS